MPATGSLLDETAKRPLTRAWLQRHLSWNTGIAQCQSLDLTPKHGHAPLLTCIDHLDQWMPRITHLNLSGNDIQLESLVRTLPLLLQLNSLNLSNNQLACWKAFTPNVMGRLRELILRGNRLARLDPCLKHAQRLVILDVSDNNLANVSDLDYLEKCRSLANLDFSDNPIAALPHSNHYCLYRLRSLALLNGVIVDAATRQAAIDQYACTATDQLQRQVDDAEDKMKIMTMQLADAKTQNKQQEVVITSLTLERDQIKQENEEMQRKCRLLEQLEQEKRRQSMAGHLAESSQALLSPATQQRQIRQLEHSLTEKETTIRQLQMQLERMRFDIHQKPVLSVIDPVQAEEAKQILFDSVHLKTMEFRTSQLEQELKQQNIQLKNWRQALMNVIEMLRKVVEPATPNPFEARSNEVEDAASCQSRARVLLDSVLIQYTTEIEHLQQQLGLQETQLRQEIHSIEEKQHEQIAKAKHIIAELRSERAVLKNVIESQKSRLKMEQRLGHSVDTSKISTIDKQCMTMGVEVTHKETVTDALFYLVDAEVQTDLNSHESEMKNLRQECLGLLQKLVAVVASRTPMRELAAQKLQEALSIQGNDLEQWQRLDECLSGIDEATLIEEDESLVEKVELESTQSQNSPMRRRSIAQPCLSPSDDEIKYDPLPVTQEMYAKSKWADRPPPQFGTIYGQPIENVAWQQIEEAPSPEMLARMKRVHQNLSK